MPAIEREDETAVQDMMEHENLCFGCGPHNPEGFRLKSYPGDGEMGLVAEYQGEQQHAGSAGVLGGGPQSTLVDCHGIWTATWRAIAKGEDPVPHYVTAKLETTFRAPAPIEDPVRLVSTVERVDGRRVHVDVEVQDPEGNLLTEGTVVCHRLDEAWGRNPRQG